MEGFKIIKRNILFLLAISILFIVAAFTTLQYRKTVRTIKEEQIHTFRGEYEALVEGYELVSKSFLENVIETRPEIARIIHRASNGAAMEEKETLRKQLADILDPYYWNLMKYNFRQLHFHLNDTTSFYRFHRPERWGDDLTGIRPTITAVGKTRQPVKGFEEGRIFNGYRYVFPLFHESVFSGTVEVSTSMNAIIESLNKLYERPVQFLLLTEVMKTKVFTEEQKQYTPWKLSDLYVLDPANQQEVFEAEQFTDREKIRIMSSLSPGPQSAFSLHTLNFDTLVFLPIRNFEGKPVAVLVTMMDDQAFLTTRRSFILSLFLIFSLVILLIYLAVQIERSHTRLDYIASYDSLTGVFSRRSFLRRLDEDLQRCTRYRTPLSLIYFDIDYFKEINDTYGHAEGDCVLREFCKTVQSRLRGTDYFGRLGGDEFIAVLPGTDRTGAEKLAQIMYSKLKSTPLCRTGIISCSMGVGEAGAACDSAEHLIHQVDQALYASKRNGRDRITVL